MVDDIRPLEEPINGNGDDDDDLEHFPHHLRPIWGPVTWNMSPNQPPMPVLASRHYPPPLWPLRKRRSWEILPPPGIFPALRPDQTRFRGLRSPDTGEPLPPWTPGAEFSESAVQFGDPDPNAKEKRMQRREGRRGRPRRDERMERGEIRDVQDWPSGGGAE